VLLATACAASLAWPSVSAAQRAVFLDGLSELTTALVGTYGDEGALIEPSLDKMAKGLARWDESIRAFEARVASESPGAALPAAVQLRATLGGMYIERGRLADALRELDAASRLRPEDADIHLLRALVLETSGRSTEAGRAFHRAWTLDAGDPVKAYHVVRHKEAIGDIQEVERAHSALAEAYTRLLQDRQRTAAAPFVVVAPLQGNAGGTPALVPAAYIEGFAHVARADLAEAVALVRKAAAADPLVTDPAAGSAVMKHAAAALRQGRPAEARPLLESSDWLPDSSEARRVLGLAYWMESQNERSIEQLETAIRMNPRDERSRLLLSRVLSLSGRDASARQVLHELLEVFPGSALAHWWLAPAYENLDRFQDARRELEAAARGVVAGHSRFHEAIGRVATNSYDFPAAREAFARAVGVNPNDPTARRSLAGVLLQQDLVDEAFAELVAAVLIDPQDVSAHAAIGRIHLNAGRHEEAVAALRHAVALSPDDTEARYALATALARSGDAQEAAQQLERVARVQRQALADRRRDFAIGVMKQEAALDAAEGRYDRAVELWRQVVDRQPGQSANHQGLAAALAGDGRVAEAIEQYETAARLGAEADVYRQLAALYEAVGRVDDAARARAAYERALGGGAAGRDTAR
jgi:tetratricopeptide (TPR) repeat protein